MVAQITKHNEAELFPAEPPQRRMSDVFIADVEFDAVGPPPSPQLIRDIKYNGVHTPVWVSDEDGVFRLIAGRRRLLACQELGLTTIPAIIQPAGYEWAGMLSDHALRKDNPAAELAAIEELLAEGSTEAQIAQRTGMPVGTIRARLRLTRLCDELREAFNDGEISLATAEAAAKLDQDTQHELAEELDETGKLTAKTARDARRVQRDHAVDQLDLGAFDTLDVTIPSQPASVETYMATMNLDASRSRDLAVVGLLMLDSNRLDEARKILERISTMKEGSA